MKSLILMWLGCIPALAGSAAFLPGGKQVARADEERIMVLNLEDHTEAPLVLPDGVKVQFPPLAATDSLLLVITGNQVMGWNPATKEWKPFCATPDGMTLRDMAVNLKTGAVVLVATRGEDQWQPIWWLLEKGKEAPVKVLNRRAEDPESPVFDAAGTLYYCASGDIWRGDFEAIEQDEEASATFLTGDRIWPIAEKVTSSGNSAGVSAHGILPLPKFLIVDRSRTGGSGWGAIIRLPNENAYEKHLALKWDELQSSEGRSNMALSADGKRAMVYVASAEKWFDVDPETGKWKAAGAAAKKKGH